MCLPLYVGIIYFTDLTEKKILNIEVISDWSEESEVVEHYYMKDVEHKTKFSGMQVPSHDTSITGCNETSKCDGNSPSSNRSFVYQIANPSPNRSFPLPWTLKWTCNSQSLSWQGYKER